jgi:hypothetical protein
VNGRRRYPRRTSARVIAASLDVAVGVRMLMPDDIFGTNPGYRLLDRIFFGDIPFGLVTLTCGLVGIAALRSDHFTWPAIITTIVALANWSIVAIALLKVNPGQIGSLAYVAIAATNIYALAHTARWQWMRGNPTGGNQSARAEVG